MRLIIFIFFLFQYASYSQFNDIEYGAGFHYQFISHQGSFGKLNEIPNCCPEFKSGDGTGIDAFLFYKIPLYKDLDGELRIGFSFFNAQFVHTEITKVSIDNQAIDGEFSHILESDFTNIVFQPMLSYELFEKFSLKLGFNFGYFLTGSFYQIEKISKPIDRGTYIRDGVNTGLRKWNEFEGDIPGLFSFQINSFSGLSYDLPMNSSNSLWFSPELCYQIGFTDLVENTPWTLNAFQLGLTLKYRPNPEVEYIEDNNLEETSDALIAKEIELLGNQSDLYFGEFKKSEQEPEIEKVQLDAKISAVGVADGQEYEEATMVIEEFLSTNMRPLLNYVFFDNNSSVLPDRYLLYDTKRTEKFSQKDLCNLTTLRTYYDLLNIIGLRMKENPDATVELTGCNTGRDNNGTRLSQERADIVYQYLTQIWKIDAERLTTKVRNLPEIPSNQRTNDGVEENRRTEIYSDSWEIMKPVLTEDTLRKVSPPIIRFYLETESDHSISNWQVSALQNGEVLKVFKGKGKVPDKVDWWIDREKETVPKFSEPIEYMIEVNDSKGNTSFSETGLLPTDIITIQKKKENRLGDKRIDRYSLILFNFNSDSLTVMNNKIVDFIKGRLQSDSRVLISGFTDRMGDDALNFRLSKGRAEQTASSLGRANAFIRGVGESELIYNNDLPEGRFYCRTVEIEVETPISWNK